MSLIDRLLSNREGGEKKPKKDKIGAATPVSPQDGPPRSTAETSRPEQLAEFGPGAPDYQEMLRDIEAIHGVIGEDLGTEEADENTILVEFTIAEVLELLPDRYLSEDRGGVDLDQVVKVPIINPYDQLANGAVVASVIALARNIPASLLAGGIDKHAAEEVSIPLRKIVTAISPEELRKRSARPEREPNVYDMPNLFDQSATQAMKGEEAPVEPEQPTEPEPTPVHEPTPVPTPEPAPAPEPVTEPEPEAEPVPSPTSEPEPAPVPSAVPTPKPEPAPVPSAVPTPEPEPVPVPSAVPTPKPEPAPVPSAVPIPEPEPAPEPTPTPPPKPVAAPAQPIREAPAPVVMVRDIDINHAPVDEMRVALPGLGRAMAERIVEHRPYRTPFDLKRVRGIGRTLFRKLTGLAMPGRSADLEAVERLLTGPDGKLPSFDLVAQGLAEQSGVAGCILSHSDGYLLAAAWKRGKGQSIGAIAPQIFKHVGRYFDLLQMPSPDSIMLYVDPRPVFITRKGDVFMIVVLSRSRATARRLEFFEVVTSELVRRWKRKPGDLA